MAKVADLSLPGLCGPRPGGPSLEALGNRIDACRACPRLVAWREAVAVSPAALRSGQTYWARPLRGFGDPAARLVLVGLAPAAHGGNRTGRMFTGDRSGDFLYAALHRAGYANQAESRSRDDGLELSDAYVTASVRCAPPENKPLPEERRRCAPFLAAELAALEQARVLLALGAFAFDALLRQELVGAALARAAGDRRPRFSHGLELELAPLRSGGPPRTLLCTYHPSQRNVFTGLLTAEMIDAVIARARQLCEATGAAAPGSRAEPDLRRRGRQRSGAGGAPGRPRSASDGG